MALTLYLLFQTYFLQRWLALSLTLFALFDAKMWLGKPLVGHVATFCKLFLGADTWLLANNPRIAVSWRIIDPALSGPFLLLYIWLMARAIKSSSPAAARVAGIGFGLCFTYFYAWTAVAGGLVLAVLLDRKHWRIYCTTGTIGALIGCLFLLPEVTLKWRAVPDWPTRIDFFIPIGHFSELLIPKTAFILAALTSIWVWRWHRDLLYLWCICAAALLLLNEQIVTGLQIQNFHWYIVWGPTLWLLIVILTVRTVELRPNWRRPGAVAGLVVLAFTIATGTWLRAKESQSRQSVDLTRELKDFQSEYELNQKSIRAQSVVGGDSTMVSFLAILNDNRPLSGFTALLSSCVDNREWNQRIAANAYFSGLDRESFARREEGVIETFVGGVWSRDPRQRKALLEERLQAFDKTAADPSAVARRFDLRYLLLPATARADHLGDDWISVVHGSDWQAWERK